MSLKDDPNVKLIVTGVISATVAAVAVYAISTFSAGVDAASEQQIKDVVEKLNVTPRGESFGAVLDDHGDKLDALILKLGFVEKSIDKLSEE